MRINTKLRVGLAAAAAGAMSIAIAAPAHADYAPSGSDAVGVGSDTVQYLMDFGADGDTDGDLGYNSGNFVNKLVNFDATPDANARAGYADGSTALAPIPLNPTIVLRAGTNPVQRPNGSGAGIAALIADTGTAAFPSGEINYARASRLPKSTENTAAAAEGGLHVVRLGTEDLRLAVANTTNAPTSLTAIQLYHIYQCDTGYRHWNDSGLGNGTGSADAIVPIIPQPSSGTGSTFEGDLATAAGTTFTLGSCVEVEEENDPTSITSDAHPADAIDPFSSSRLALYNDGYFHNPATAYPGSASALTPGIKLLTAAGAYDDNRGLYIVFKQNDATSATKFEPGSKLNVIQTLFSNPGGATPYFNTAAGKALVAAAGAVAAYKDCGLNVTSC